MLIWISYKAGDEAWRRPIGHEVRARMEILAHKYGCNADQLRQKGE